MVNKGLIVFVDRGNISRSPIAESVARRKLEEQGLQNQYEVISRGTQGVAPDDKEPVKFPNITYYHDHYIQSKSWLDEHGIDLSSHTSTPINREIAEKAKIMFAMDRKTQESLLALFPDHAVKVHILSEIVGEDREIIDPENVNEKLRLEQIYNEIEDMIVNGLPNLLALVDGINEINKEVLAETLTPRRCV